jgi:hypothetical protein
VASNVRVDAVPKPIPVGPEMEALRRFCRDSTWEGWIREGGMGPGTPIMKGIGRANFRSIQDGRWFVGDFEQDQFLADGTFVLKWELHWVVGWAPMFGEYRAAMADAYGNTDVYRGNLEGDLLVFETMPDVPVRLRFTWDASDPAVTTWRNEMALEDGSWFLIEEYPMLPAVPSDPGR